MKLNIYKNNNWEGLKTVEDVEMDKLIVKLQKKYYKKYGVNYATKILKKLKIS